MIKIYKLLTIVIVLCCTALQAQPVIGTTDFAVNGTISWNTNSPCVATKTADVQGWLVSVNSTSNCGINQSNSGSFADSDGRLQYLVGFGTLSQASFGTDDGSEFALVNLAWSSSTYSFASKSISFVGYRNGLPVSGATLVATTGPLPWSTASNSTLVNFSGNPNFSNVDNVLVIPTQTCSSILAFEQITISTASICVTSPTVSLVGSSSVSCNGGNNGTATVSATGAGPFTYAWSPSGGTGSSASGLSAGVYTCAVTNSCSISSAQTVTITQPSALVTSTAVTNVACNGGSNGVASITASGGAGGYTYLWSNGGTTSAITGLMAGAYSATVTDSHSCKSIKSAVVTQPSALVTSTAVTNVACNGGSNGVASISASGGAGSYSYLWSNGATTSAITGLMAGAYSATVTDANSCTSIKSAVVTQPSALVTSTAVTNVACNGGSNGVASISASGGAGSYTYLWSNGATTSAITGLLAGAYSATVTDANSCTSIKGAVVTQPSALVTSTAVTNVACNGGSNGVASITASGGVGGYTYLWSNGSTTSAITGLLAGAYSATVTDANSCTSIKGAVVTQPSALVTSTAVTNVSCNSGSNGSATITPSGGTAPYTYLWSNGATTSAVSGLLAGAYSSTITDSHNCTTVKGAIITQPSALVTSTAVTLISCNGGGNGSATITASGGVGGYTYLWSNGATTSAVSGLLAGAYSATVTDANSCTSSKISVVTQPSAIVSSTSVTNANCSGSTGSATLTVSGGTTPYSYLWSNSATTPVISGLAAGPYISTVTDANGCTSSKSVTITSPSALSANTSVSPVLCNGGIATLTISATGGTPSYTGTGTFTATAGVSSYTITDANNCSVTTSVTITQPSVLTVNAATSSITCNGGIANVTVTAAGGTPSYSGTGTYTMVAGSATYTVSDNNNCSTTATVAVTQPAAIVSSQTLSICAGQSYTIGSSTYTASGIYVNVLSSFITGCDSTVTSNLTVNNSINVSTSATGLVISANNTVAATYQWIDCNNSNQPVSGAVTSSYTASGNGNYAVSITENGCTATSTCVNVTATGINTNGQNTSVSVYPNPNNGQFTIELTSKAHVQITDALGRIIYNENIAPGKQLINLSNEKNGIYLVKIITPDNQFVKRIVLNK